MSFLFPPSSDHPTSPGLGVCLPGTTGSPWPTPKDGPSPRRRGQETPFCLARALTVACRPIAAACDYESRPTKRRESYSLSSVLPTGSCRALFQQAAARNVVFGIGTVQPLFWRRQRRPARFVCPKRACGSDSRRNPRRFRSLGKTRVRRKPPSQARSRSRCVRSLLSILWRLWRTAAHRKGGGCGSRGDIFIPWFCAVPSRGAVHHGSRAGGCRERSSRGAAFPRSLDASSHLPLVTAASLGSANRRHPRLNLTTLLAPRNKLHSLIPLPPFGPSSWPYGRRALTTASNHEPAISLRVG